MNANEVIANRAIELLGGELGSKTPVHPNDHVNRGQSQQRHLPDRDARRRRAGAGRAAAPGRSTRWWRRWRPRPTSSATSSRSGRTHLQDATPMTLGQEIGAWAAQIRDAQDDVRYAGDRARALAIGGTAVGTGLNAPAEFGATRGAAPRRRRRASPFHQADEPVRAAGLARRAGRGRRRRCGRWPGALMKMANDVRWLASGPAHRHRRAAHPGERARLVDHAGQGQPDPVRGDDDGRHPGLRQRRHGGLRRVRRATSSSTCSRR